MLYLLFLSTDAIAGSSGDSWTQYGNPTYYTSAVNSVSSYYKSNARLARILFKISAKFGSSTKMAGPFLHQSQVYQTELRYVAPNGVITGGTIVEIRTDGYLYTAAAMQVYPTPSGSNYIEIIYPYSD